MGTWSYVYSAFGELITQTDGKGQITSIKYDELGRIIKKILAG
ncbi:RHS repeat domain-containing protein [Abyssogena phaseoliformis symbiont]|nr:RHS repeat domain-containing protein [Abyssogena phaseoliformis symbiont]